MWMLCVLSTSGHNGKPGEVATRTVLHQVSKFDSLRVWRHLHSSYIWYRCQWFMFDHMHGSLSISST